MNTPLRRARLLFVLLLASGAGVWAHPGHDGHELTWDFAHLSAHPVATLLCAGFLVTATWGVAQAAGAWLARRQSLRKSAVSGRK